MSDKMTLEEAREVLGRHIDKLRIARNHQEEALRAFKNAQTELAEIITDLEWAYIQYNDML